MPKQKDLTFVTIQFTLFGVYLLPISVYDLVVPFALRITGLGLFLVGAVVIILALLALNRHLSAFPTPKADGELIESSVYKRVRHPIYTGILLGTLGMALYSESVVRLLIFAALLLLFTLKARYEEQLLLGKYPGYAAYMTRTGMFLP